MAILCASTRLPVAPKLAALRASKEVVQERALPPGPRPRPRPANTYPTLLMRPIFRPVSTEEPTEGDEDRIEADSAREAKRGAGEAVDLVVAVAVVVSPNRAMAIQKSRFIF